MRNVPKLHKRGPAKPTWSAAKAVRSYKLDEDIATDHRTGKKASAAAVLDGNIELLNGHTPSRAEQT